MYYLHDIHTSTASAKLLVLGRTGAGKDALRVELENRGLRFVKSYATRPQRTPDEDTHTFITEDEAKELLATEEIVAKTVIDGYTYFATKRQVEEADAYIIDPDGLTELSKQLPYTAFHLAYVHANPVDREMAAIARCKAAEGETAPLVDVFKKRNRAEDGQFTRFEDDLKHFTERTLPENVCAVHTFENDYSPETLANEADAIICEMTLQANVEGLVSRALDINLLEAGDTPNTIRVVTTDGSTFENSPSEFACNLIANETDFVRFMQLVLSYKQLPALVDVPEL